MEDNEVIECSDAEKTEEEEESEKEAEEESPPEEAKSSPRLRKTRARKE